MASRRSLIVDAVVTALQDITVANGWPMDLVAAHVEQDTQDLAGTVGLSRHRAFVVPSGGIPDLKQMHSHIRESLDINVDLFPAQDATANVKDAMDPLLTAVEKRLLQAIASDPPFGVAGVDDAALRWEPFLTGTNTTVGATWVVSVLYRHDVDDPSTYGGL